MKGMITTLASNRDDIKDPATTYPCKISIVVVFVRSGGFISFDLCDNFTTFNRLADLFLPFLKGANFHRWREGRHVNQLMIWQG